ncbi:ribonuclease H-like domain-containing protein [Tanacetum coccineum]|uniref:Ribonuclease H-like domain-containing protein n=2 Tax=Tanacetum coccineum TaxID=301880 RepID=A0ABQ4XZB2_9ASTR
MQDKNIAISELKKLIENCKGKSVETQFNKPYVVRQPNAQRIPKPSVLGKPTPFSNSPEMRSFQTKQSVNKTNVSDGLFKQVTQQNLPQIRKQAVRNTNVIAPGPSRNCPKHVSHQSPREKVGSNDMVHNYYLEKAKKSAQLQKDKEVNGKPSMIDPARLPNTANGCKPKPRNWQASMSSRCLYSANHDECVLEYLSRLNPCASAQNKDAKSLKTTKRYMPVEKSSASKKPERQIPTGHRFSNKKTTTVLEKTMNPRSCLRWKPTGRIFSNVHLRWVPTGKLFNSCTSKVESEPTHGLNVDIHHIHACKQTLGLSAGTSFNGQKQQRIDLNADALYNEKQENLRVWLLKLLISKKPVPECSSLVLHQMMSDHNSSDLAPQRQEMSVENVSSGLVPQGQKASDYDNSDPVPPRQNVVPTAEKTDSSQQGLEFLFSPLLEEYYNPTHGHTEDNNNDQAPNASFQEDEFINPFCTRVQEIVARLEAVFGFSAAYAAHNSISNLSDGRKMHFLMVTEGEVYVLQPEGFVDPEHPEKSLLLMESLYGLKQAPRAWYDELSNFLMSKGFTKKIHQSPKDLSGEPVDQSDYRSKIGSLMYLTSSRPDLVQAVCYCARYQARPTQKHLKEVKRIFKYLKGTINMGLWYPKDSGFELTAFSDADHAGCLDTRKSTSGGIQFLGDKLVSWMSKKQNCTAMSSAEAEYVALSASCAQVMWMRTQLQDYGFNYNKIPLYCDSQSAIAISCNPVQHSRTKHIHTRYHFIKEQVENGIIELYFVRTEYQLADMFTKALPEDRFKYLVRRIGMRCLTPADLEVLTNETA